MPGRAAFEEIRGWQKQAGEQAPERRTDCPRCDYPLEETDAGISHCKFCGWTEGLSIRRRRRDW
ncbi:hypothetical protein CMI37_13880 [Candidatus Pacearchaeota archaeon]|nr:hypothetical protein [Candidatus Pacearchaeota archaeon]